MLTSTKKKIIDYIKSIQGNESIILQTLMLKEIVSEDTPIKVLYRDATTAIDLYGKDCNAAFNLLDILSTGAGQIRVRSNKQGDRLHSTKEDITFVSNLKNTVYIVHSNYGIDADYSRLLTDEKFKNKISWHSSVPQLHDIAREYTVVICHDAPKPKEYYIQKYNSEKLIITFGKVAWFILDRNVLLIDANINQPDSVKLNSRLLAKIVPLFSNLLTSHYTKEQFTELIASYNDIINNFNNLLAKQIEEESINILISSLKYKKQAELDQHQQDLKNVLQRLDQLYELINDTKLSIVMQSNIKQEVKVLLDTMYETLDIYVKLKIIKKYRLKPIDNRRKIVEIEIITYPIPQNYIDLDKLKKCLPEFPYAKELVEQNERLFVAPMRMLLILDILNPRRPIGMIYDPYSTLISEHGTINNHTQYYDIPSEWEIGRTEEYRKGCLGSFEPKMIEAQRLFATDKIKAIKQYIHLTMQYIQSTNVLDSAGQNNIRYGYYVDSNNIVVHQSSDKLKGKNIYDVQYKY